MNDDTWTNVKRIFDAALDRDSAERAGYVVQQCDGDGVLRAQVEELLSSYQTDFLEPNAGSNGAGGSGSRADALKPGQVIGRYKIIRLLGVGGMGEVYLARDADLDRKAAVKVFTAERAIRDEHLERFIREAQAASALNHPNICTIYQIEKDNDPPFIAMEYIEGETLAEKIGKRRLEIKEMIDIATQAADALAEAHGSGIVHRDIKPANIIINKRGQVKVVDFGLAKKLVSASDDATQRQLSRSGTIVGTVRYMSPEQARGQDVDSRTDIWSLGVVLYEMLAGRHPFDGETTGDAIAEILRSDPPMLDAGDLSEVFNALVGNALAKDKSARYPTARHMIADLQKIRDKVGRAEGDVNVRGFVDQTTVVLDQTTAHAGRDTQHELNGTAAAARYKWAMAILLIAGVAGVAALYYARQGGAAIGSVAVMPFSNDTGNPESEFLSDGITESLIGRLSQIPNLSVKARSSVFRFKGKDVAIKDIGNELKVPAILTGRVAQRGDQLSLYVELIDAATENVMWRAEYNRPETSLATIPGEVARDVANSLRQKLTGADEKVITKNYTQNAEAYQLYLKGRFYWDKRNEEAYRVAEDAYKQAIALDQNYALAYAGLADCYLFREIGLGRDVAMPRAKEYALKALDLDESLAEAHTTLAFVNANYELDLSAGEKEFKRAIELKPNYAIAHQFYGSLLAATGRTDEALAEMQRALDLEPYSAAINWSLGLGLGFGHRYDESIAQLQKTLQIQPNYELAEVTLTSTFIHSGRYDKAMALVQKHLAVPERRDGALANLSIIYAKTDREVEARKALDQLLTDSTSQNNPYNIARVYAARGDKDKTMDWLDKALERRSFMIWFLGVDPSFDGLRDDPKFNELLRKIGL